MKYKKFFRHTVCPLIGAVIWGTAFSAQSICSEHLPPFAVNAFRSLVTALVLGLVCLLFRIKPDNRRELAVGGLVCGTALFLAVNLQQFGISQSSAGKAGFITALYIVLVPLLGTFLGKRTARNMWIAVLIAVFGLYFLCVSGDFDIALGDISLLLCALMFAVQILSIDRFSQHLNPIALSTVEFLVCGLLSALCSLIMESTAPVDYLACIWPLLYIAIFSSCIAYTLQIYAQKGGNAVIVSLLLSLEAVFAVLGAMLFLNERMSLRELLGCLLMAAAVVIAQLPERKRQTRSAR